MKSSLVRFAATAVLLVGATAPAQAAFLDFLKKKPAPPAPAASIASVAGTVSYQPKGAPASTAAQAGQLLAAGDAVKTGDDGKAVIAFSDGSKVQLSANAAFAMESIAPALIGVRLDVGVLEAWVKKVAGRRFQTRTPTAVASVRGTEFRTEVGPSGQTTWDLFGGSLDVANNAGQTVRVEPGQRVALDTAGTIEPVQPIPPTVKMAVEPVVQLPAPAPAPAKVETKEEAPAEETAPEEVKVEEAKTEEPPPPTASQDVKTAPPPEAPKEESTVSPSSP